ncbi:MAG: GNAT family N-acetyltransferase [Polaromonas sp.]|nr:GNAT family N-acetyltransferase [Polaromonas sp.]
MSLVIRQADTADLPAVLALYAQLDFNNGNVLSEQAAQQIFAEFARYPSYRLFVATEGSVVVGSYALLVMHNLAHGGTPSAVVEDVVVASDQQGRGIGRQLMSHAKDQARAAGCYKLALSSNRQRHAAHAFYESLGFDQHGLSFVIEP